MWRMLNDGLDAALSRIPNWVYWLLYGGALVYIALGYGSWWEFSPHWLPVNAVAPDGFHYKSGREIDFINLALIRSGKEEEVMGATLLVVAVLLACGIAKHYWEKKRG